MAGLMTLSQAALRFGINLRALQHRVGDGTLRTTRDPHHMSRHYVTSEDVAAWKAKPKGGDRVGAGLNYYRVRGLHASGMSNVSIAEYIGITRERVRQLVLKAAIRGATNDHTPG